MEGIGGKKDIMAKSKDVLHGCFMLAKVDEINKKKREEREK